MSTAHFPPLAPPVHELWAAELPPSLQESYVPTTGGSRGADAAYLRSRRVERRLRGRQVLGWEHENALLEEEEARLESSLNEIRTFGYSWMIPIGKRQTQEDEQDNGDLAGAAARQPVLEHPPAAQASADVSGLSAADSSAGQAQQRDLDASIEDLDASMADSVDAQEDIFGETRGGSPAQEDTGYVPGRA